MPRSSIAASTLALVAFLWSAPAHPWAEHHLVTRHALAAALAPPAGGGEAPSVVVTPFARVLALTGSASEVAFNEKLQIRKDYRFAFGVGEREGRRVPLLDVVAHYADEPDWGMDLNLFDADQYPQLWRDEYAMMGGRERGTPSQAFRHMHWQGWGFKHPVETFRLPLGSAREPIGEAPARARMFVELARRARAAGLEYWAARFTANALHYVEDVTSPFHAAQTPTKRFISLPVTSPLGGRGRNFVKEVTRVVSYYHFAFEDYLGSIFKEEAPALAGFARALGGEGATPKLRRRFDYGARDPEALVRDISALTVAQSADAGRASLEFFPEIRVPFSQFDPSAYMDAEWWRAVKEAGKHASPARDAYFATAEAMFLPLGIALRSVVAAELR